MSKEMYDKVNYCINMLENKSYTLHRESILFRLGEVRSYLHETKLEQDPVWFRYALKLTKLLLCGILYHILLAKSGSSKQRCLEEALELCNEMSSRTVLKSK